MALVTVQRSPTPSTTSSPSVSESGSGEDDRRSQPRSSLCLNRNYSLTQDTCHRPVPPSPLLGQPGGMTLGALSGSDCSSAVSVCSCCGADMGPYFSEDNHIDQLISESFLTVKGAALFLPRGNSPTPSSAAPRVSERRNKHTGDLQKHLQTMFTVLRPEDTIRLAVRLESSYPQVTRYMVVVSTNGRQDTEESIVLGMDFVTSDSCCTVGLVLPLWSDTLIHLDGDGGFSVSTVNRSHVFKPVSVQAMWSALQSLHKASEVARCHNHYPGSLFLTWVSYYQSRVSSNQFCVNEWNAMQDVESHRANSPVLFTDLPTERERTERLIKTRLREIMMQKDLENVTCKEIRTELEMQMVCNLREFKEFIDNEMILILGQMDSPTEIFEHVYLGSEWNASNLEELQASGVRYILNVTREIDNFFPGMFEYHNIRVYDEEATNLLEYWNETYKFITKAKKAGAKCLVHCKMGVSRSASTVIAYAMKEYGWSLDTAFDHVKDKRAVTKPNPSFMKQLEEYQGILLASKQRHNKLWRSHSDSDLTDRAESMCKASSLGRSDSHNNNTTTSSPSLHHFLGVAVLQALGAEPRRDSAKSSDSDGGCDSPGHAEDTSDCEDTPLPPPHPVPGPTAPVVVPEESKPDNSAPGVVTLNVPALHVLPPTPELQRAHRRCPPTHLSLSLPRHTPTPPEPSPGGPLEEEASSPLTLGSADYSDSATDRSLSDSPGDKRSPVDPPLPHHHLLPTPPPPLLAPSDDNNNPRGEADGSSNHSADSIDFFSAREKFLGLGLGQDGRARAGSEQTTHPRTPCLSPEEHQETEAGEEEEEQGSVTSQTEDGVDKASPPHHDNGVSVRHIVTEIEAISHPSSGLPTPSPSSSSSSSSSVPPSSLSPQLVIREPEPETEPQTPEATPGSLTPPSPSSSSSSMLPCDWPAGSVRRATKQLEQKLRQELELAVAQRSPLHSPSAEHPPGGRPSTEPLPLRHPQPQPEHTVARGEDPTASSVQSKDGDEHTDIQRLNSSSGTDSNPLWSPDSNISHASGTLLDIESHMLQTSSVASDGRLDALPVGTSARSQTCGDGMTVDGVTVRETDTDERAMSPVAPGRSVPCCEAQSRLSRGSQELERIQLTLRELQAFLQDQPQGPPGDSMDTGQGPCKTQRCGPEAAQRLPSRQDGESFPEPTAWHRAMELEARIRQAGLTPPSLMKRSASLAKLDCLELSATDLSDLDLRTHARSPSSSSSSHPQDSFSAAPTHHDDTWKKQKVLAGTTACPGKTVLSHGCDSASSPSLCHPVPPPAPQLQPRPQEGTGEREEPDGDGDGDGGGGALTTAARQQGRGHSSRRSKKAPAEKKQRAETVLYNTM